MESKIPSKLSDAGLRGARAVAAELTRRDGVRWSVVGDPRTELSGPTTNGKVAGGD